MLAQQPLVVAGLRFLPRRVLVLRAVKAFFAALAFPLLFALTLISQFSSPCRMFLSLEISFSLLSVWPLACGAVSFFERHSPRAFYAVSTPALCPRPSRISPLAKRPSLILLFWRWQLSVAWRKVDVFWLPFELRPLLSLWASETFLVSETTTRREARFPRIDHAAVVHRLPREGCRRLLRQTRGQLRAKCECAPLRRRVTERATRSTLTAVICEKSYNSSKQKVPGSTIPLSPSDFCNCVKPSLQARAREAQLCAFFRVRAG